MDPLRRDFLLGSAAAFSCRPARADRLAPLTIRVASNQGIENATLQQLMVDRGFARRLALDIVIVESKEIAGPIAALEADSADLCMISAYAGILPAIEAKQPIRLIGTAMQVPALAVCATGPALRDVHELAGRRVGIGEQRGLLHLVMLALLRRNGMAPEDVRFVTVGSNAQVFRAILRGEVDAGPCGVADLSDLRAHILDGGRLWRALPDFTYQFAYASHEALRTRREAVARCLAAYSLLFRFVSEAGSRAAYRAAREKAGGDRVEADQVWQFIQHAKPYPRNPGLSAAHVAMLQRLNLSVGLQRRIMPFEEVVDLVPATTARRLLSTLPRA